MDFYDKNAEAFYNNTVDVDMQPLYQTFIKSLPANASVVDAGCGSGRDSRFFIGQGFSVIAFDQSKTLAQKASELIQQSVAADSFLSMTINEGSQDGIWACASLLHVPFNELPSTVEHMATWLKSKGIFYCSFKYGDGECLRGDRLFSDMNEQRLERALKLSSLAIHNTWQTEDRRKGREDEKWLNALLIKQ